MVCMLSLSHTWGEKRFIGRLLFDSKKLYEDQLAALERDSKRVGNAGDHIDYALL